MPGHCRGCVTYYFKDETKVYPGHGESTTYGYLLENNPDIIEVKNWIKNK